MSIDSAGKLDPEAEYIGCHHALADASPRAFQATSILAASGVAGAVVLGNVLPRDDLPDWMKLLSAWTFATALVPLVLYWMHVFSREVIVSSVAIRRMVDLELRGSARRALYTCLLLDWANRENLKEWLDLSETDKEELAEKVRQGILRPMPSILAWPKHGYSLRHRALPVPAILFPSAVVAIAALGASVVTVWVLTTRP